MKKRLLTGCVLAAALWGWSAPLSAQDAAAQPQSVKQKLIGAWRMASMEEVGPDGAMTTQTERSGMLIYTADGHVSVQVMYPEAEADTTADDAYQEGGYEASFGSYQVDERNHTVTNRYAGSLVRRLIGQPLTRVIQFNADGRLTLRAADPKEKWSVTWERYR